MDPRCYEDEMKNKNYEMNYSKENPMMMGDKTMCPPIYECPETRVCDRYIMHEVPQD